MSLSKPQLKNPADRFMQWRGGAEAFKDKDGKTDYEGGRITYYDKEAKEEYEVALPLFFTVLDELHTITGFSEKDHSGFWSNEVSDLKDTLIVRTKSGIVAKGKYADIKDKIKGLGAKYAKSVYIAFKDESGELVIGNIKFTGSSLTPWIEFQKEFDVSVCAVKISEVPKLEKKGTNRYFSPVFEGVNLNPQTRAEALKLDEELQRYLSVYMTRKDDVEDELTADDLDEEEDQDDIHNIEGLDDQEDEEETALAPAPKKKAAPKKEEKLNVQDVEF